MSQQEAETELRRHISYNLAGKVFDPFVWSEMTDSTGKIIKPVDSNLVLTNDPLLINEFGFKTVILRGTITFTNRSIANALRSARNLLELLRKEYNLK